MEEGVKDRNDEISIKNDQEKMAECPDDTPRAIIEESVSDRNYDKNENYNEEKEAECPEDTSPIEVEEGVNDRKYDRNKIMSRIKRKNSQMKLPVLRWRQV